MKEKLLWFSALVLGAMLVTLRGQSPSTQASATPRFQVFALDVQRSPEAPKRTVVFRLDTQGGAVQTYQFGETATNDKTTSIRWSYWEKVDETLVPHDVMEEIRQSGRPFAR